MALNEYYVDPLTSGSGTGNDFDQYGGSFTDGVSSGGGTTLTKIGAFPVETTRANDMLFLSGADVTAGLYRVSSRSSDDAVVLATDIRSGVPESTTVVCTAADGGVSLPWATVQHALWQITRDASNGDRVNLKSDQAVGVTPTVDDILIASLDVIADYTLPSQIAPLVIQGYTTTASDGGIGGLDGNGSVGVFNDVSIDEMKLVNLHMHNSGAATVVNIGETAAAINCEVNNSTGSGIDFNDRCRIINCYIHDVDDYGIIFGQLSFIYGNYIANDGNNMLAGIRGTSNDNIFMHNVINLDGTPGAGDGIHYRSRCVLMNNTVFSNGGTGSGFSFAGTASTSGIFINNVVEGFSGSGGKGYEASTDDAWLLWSNNVSQSNETAEFLDGAPKQILLTDTDVDPAGALSTVFEDNASADFRMLAAHDLQTFMSVFKGATSTTLSLDRGAARHTDPLGGGGVLPGGDASNYMENQVMDYVFKDGYEFNTATVYLALYTSNPDEDNAGTEISGNGYARQSISFGAPSNGAISNDVAITFPVATGSWGTVTHFAVFDSESSGNMLVYSTVYPESIISTNDQITIDTGIVQITID